MTNRRRLSFLALALISSVSYALVVATLWIGPLYYVALGLGFKDRAAWSWFDSVAAMVAPSLIVVLSFPGRLFTYDGPGGFVVPAFITCLTWGTAIAAAIRWRKQRHAERR